MARMSGMVGGDYQRAARGTRGRWRRPVSFLAVPASPLQVVLSVDGPLATARDAASISNEVPRSVVAFYGYASGSVCRVCPSQRSFTDIRGDPLVGP